MVTIKAPEHTREILRELARNEGAPMQVILERAVEDYRRNRVLQETNAAYARLRQDPDAWHAVEGERLDLAGTLADGLD